MCFQVRGLGKVEVKVKVEFGNYRKPRSVFLRHSQGRLRRCTEPSRSVKVEFGTTESQDLISSTSIREG
jgi:hypothetical protein